MCLQNAQLCTQSSTFWPQIINLSNFFSLFECHFQGVMLHCFSFIKYFFLSLCSALCGVFLFLLHFIGYLAFCVLSFFPLELCDADAKPIEPWCYSAILQLACFNRSKTDFFADESFHFPGDVLKLSHVRRL